MGDKPHQIAGVLRAAPLWARAEPSYLSRLTTTTEQLGAVVRPSRRRGLPERPGHGRCCSGKRLGNVPSPHTCQLRLLIWLFWHRVPSGDLTRGEMFGERLCQWTARQGRSSGCFGCRHCVFFAQLLFNICFVPSDLLPSKTTLLQDIIIHMLI